LLRAGGRVAIIELDDLPWYYLHAAHTTRAELVRAEMEAAGYVLVASHEFLEHQNFLIFAARE
jgi:hypothetical protein